MGLSSSVLVSYTKGSPTRNVRQQVCRSVIGRLIPRISGLEDLRERPRGGRSGISASGGCIQLSARCQRLAVGWSGWSRRIELN